MANVPIYRALAEAFAAEGVDTFFALMGDGNMHWATAMTDVAGARMLHVRHEHCAVAMAMGYWSATGKVGVASVTSGPGFTQIMTALTTAVRSRVPMVIFAGEAPMNAKWYVQAIDQAPLALACGARYIAAHAPARMYHHLREAFYLAQIERRPVVIGIPYDLQKEPLPEQGAYEAARGLLPILAPIAPDPAAVEAIAGRLAAATCPVIVAGRGVIAAGAQAEVEALADRSGAVLATTLLARGLYDHHPFSIGVSGGYATRLAREVGERADFVLAIGASVTYYTVDGGRMYPKAEFAHVDLNPAGYNHGAPVASLHLRADARLAAGALAGSLAHQPKMAARLRSNDLRRRIAEEPADPATYDLAPGELDPRAVVAALDAIVPKDFDTVSGSGHQSYFHSVMRGWTPGRYHMMRDFGAIGNGLAYAMGVAAARGNGRVILFEGDGSLMMHVQEFETIARHGLKCLICVFNDGAYGSEIHKLREEGIDDHNAVFGRPNFSAIARSFGLDGATVTDLGQVPDLYRAYEAGTRTAVWDFTISDRVVSPRMRTTIAIGHGVM